MEEQEVDCRFILPRGRNEVTVATQLSQAFTQAREAGVRVVWEEEQSILDRKFKCDGEVIVLDPFSGPCFDHLASQSCILIGPRALMSCLSKNQPLPNLPHPVYTTAMAGLVITFSGIQDHEVKKRLAVMVRHMAGCVSSEFHDGVTHLVTVRVGSPKYRAAMEYQVPLMSTDWVEEVFRVSSLENSVTGTESRFSSLRCKAMTGLVVSVTQLTREDRMLVGRSVEQHGGTYCPTLEQGTPGLVLVAAAPEGPKYEAARKWGVPCVSTRWLFDSTDEGVCLDFGQYRLEGGETVSGIRGHDTSSLESSSLNSSSSLKSATQTSLSAKPNPSAPVMTAPTVQPKVIKDDPLLSELDLAKVKKAGGFLDGCRIYLSGFSESETVHLARVLKYGGAVRLSQLVESVTHVVHSSRSQTSTEEEGDLCPHLVTLSWMVASLTLGRLAPEVEHPFPPVLGTGAESGETSVVMEDQDMDDRSDVFEASLLAQYGGGFGA